jgi:hypothetical protein
MATTDDTLGVSPSKPEQLLEQVTLDTDDDCSAIETASPLHVC